MTQFATDPVAETRDLMVHGVVPAGTRLPDGPEQAFGADEVRVLSHGEVALVVQPLDPEHKFRAREDLFGHLELLNALAAEVPVIPVTFGTMIRGGEALEDWLHDQLQADLSSRLAYLDGRSQLVVRARYVQEVVLGEIVAEHPEIARLRAATRGQPEDDLHAERVRLGELVARAVDARRDRDLATLVAALGPLAVDLRTTKGTGLEELADVSFLVPRNQVEELEMRAEELAQQWHPHATVRLIGPMAAFDFAGQLDEGS